MTGAIYTLTAMRAVQAARDSRRPATPAELAQRLIPGYRVTPAIAMISDVLADAITQPDRRVIISTPPRTGKLVADNTPVATPDGWVRHGDIQVGDTVFHPDGTPIKVLAVHEPAMADRRVHLSDGSHLDVHHAHEWTVVDGSRPARQEVNTCRQCGAEFIAWKSNLGSFCGHSCASLARWGHLPDGAKAGTQVVTTVTQLRTVETAYLGTQRLHWGPEGKRSGRYRFQLPRREALVCEPADLPMDPYTLGAWLGDGSSSKPCITHHPDDEYEFPYPRSARCVHKTTGVITDYFLGGFLGDLRTAGVLNNKHIPAAYFRSSIEQRRALLAGLVDTDGCVSGTVTSFSNANERLVRDFAALVRSLGYRAGIHTPTAPCTSTSGIVGKQWMWKVAFSPHDEAPARLPRKRARWKAALRRRIAITKIEHIDPVPGRCITVDSEDGLYLAGDGLIPTHNSVLSSQIGVLFALDENPDAEIILACHADSLAEDHSREARRMFAEHPEIFRFKLATDKTAVSRWRVDGRKGGLLAVGIMSGIIGRGADLLLIDDPVKNSQEADSPAHRRRVMSEFRSTMMTRVHPGGSVVIIQSRWHEQDLAGMLLESEPDRWRHINIPAISESGIPDVLDRRPGVFMTSALGRTAESFEDVRRSVGSRAWYAMFQGVPSSPEGGLIKRDWLTDHRIAAAPASPVYTVVGVDPSDSGSGDACGLIAASLTADGTVAMIADQSAPMTSDAWAMAAAKLALDVGASEIAVESFAARETYQRVVRHALANSQLNGRRITVTAWPPKGSGRGGGDAVARSSALLQALETGTCVLAGYFPRFEEQAVLWQSGQHQPDSLAALVVAYDVLAHAAGQEWQLAGPPVGTLSGSGQAALPMGAGAAGRGGVTSMDEWLRKRVG